jgi:DNA-binding NarL/FixJ family response regulator
MDQPLPRVEEPAEEPMAERRPPAPSMPPTPERPIVHPRSELSERELEIIELVATGLTNLQIAGQLTISKRTVDNHVSNIFTKTGAKNRVALVNWAMDHGKICRDGFNCCTLPHIEATRPG